MRFGYSSLQKFTMEIIWRVGSLLVVEVWCLARTCCTRDVCGARGRVTHCNSFFETLDESV